MLSDSALRNVHACIASCDELINGRFIFAENLIAKILQNISDSKEIYELIAECMQNFNFDREFNRAKVKLPTKDGYFVMPESKAIVLPLVFCIFVDIRDKKLNFHEFLKNYFTSEDMNEFENFAQTVVVPFKEAIKYCFDLDNQSHSLDAPKEEEQEKHDEKEEDEQKPKPKQFSDTTLSKFMADADIILKQMNDELSLDRKVKQDLKNDLQYLILCMQDCVNKLDIKNLSAYIVALSYMSVKAHSIRFLVADLKQKLGEYYSN